MTGTLSRRTPVARFNLAMRWMMLAAAVATTVEAVPSVRRDWTIVLVLLLEYCATAVLWLGCRLLYGARARPMARVSRQPALVQIGALAAEFRAQEHERLADWRAAVSGCRHPDAEPVDLLLTGERVAWVCPACDARLPAGWAT